MSDDPMVAKVAQAIEAAWSECRDVPFPLYKREAELLAKAAINALEITSRKAERLQAQMIADLHR